MALGASPGLVQRLILGETLRLASAGVLIGIVGALALTRLAASMLYGVTATDPLTFACVFVTLAGVAMLAGMRRCGERRAFPRWRRCGRIETKKYGK